MRGFLCLCAVVAVAVTGCTTSVFPPPSTISYPFSAQLIDESRASTDAPSAFRDRAPLPSCGDIVLEQGEEIPDAAVACMRSAMLGAGGELAVVRPTTEGDPIVTFYRVGPGIRGATVFTDMSHDRYGGGGWDIVSCSGAGDVTAAGFCP